MPKSKITQLTMILRLAWRNIWRQRRRTLITMASTSLGLAVALFAFAITEGVYTQVINDGVGMETGHITLEHPRYREEPSIAHGIGGVTGLRQRLRQVAGISRVKLLLTGQGVARSGTEAVSVTIVGVEPEVERKVSPIASRVVSGSYLAPGDDSGIVVGAQLAKLLNLKTGEELVLTIIDLAGKQVEKPVSVKGIFRTGSDEMDSYLVQAPLDFVRRIFGLDGDTATQVGVILSRGEAQDSAMREIQARVGPKNLAVFPWQQIRPELAAHLRMDRACTVVFQGLLLLVVLFTIFNTLLMSTVEREREFAVLLALGTPPGLLKAQLFVESAYISLISCAFGMALGGVIALVIQKYGLDFGALLPKGATFSGFAISRRIHAHLTWPLLLKTTGFVLATSLLLGLIPIRHIARVPVAEQLR